MACIYNPYMHYATILFQHIAIAAASKHFHCNDATTPVSSVYLIIVVLPT